MTTNDPKQVDEFLINQVYDIALDPTNIEELVNQWTDAGIANEAGRLLAAQAELFGATLERHVVRAQSFLEKGEELNKSPIAEAVSAFESSAAFVVDTQSTVIFGNTIAKDQMNVSQGSRLEGLLLEPGQLEDFQRTITEMAVGRNTTSTLVQLYLKSFSNTVLFHLRLLQHDDPQYGPLILVVSTQYYWQDELGALLEENFGLTEAEQGIIRGLVEGKNIKEVAEARDTSEGTVRSQVKSIFAKMDVNSQTDVIRTTLLLRDVVKRPASRLLNPAKPLAGQDWLEREVYKPFEHITLPDGRNFQYHTQGPVDGMPIVLSHGMSALIRWPRFVLQEVYQKKLRIITPVRAGYGQSDFIEWSTDIIETTRQDMLFLLDHLEIDRCPYVTTGSDFYWAVDLAVNTKRVSEIIGICARPPLPNVEVHEYSNRWYAFFQFTAKYAPKLFYYAVNANIAMCRRVGTGSTVKKWHASSKSDLKILNDLKWTEPWDLAMEQILLSSTDSARALAMELKVVFENWCDLIEAARDTPIKIYHGGEDPTTSAHAINLFHAQYPWIDFHTFEKSGSGVFCDHYDQLLEDFARAANAMYR